MGIGKNDEWSLKKRVPAMDLGHGRKRVDSFAMAGYKDSTMTKQMIKDRMLEISQILMQGGHKRGNSDNLKNLFQIDDFIPKLFTQGLNLNAT